MKRPAASAVAGGHELYLYWRTSQADWSAAAAALSRWQQQLCEQHPGLQARWLRRADGSEEHATLMEIYTQPGGVEEATAQRIVEEGAMVLTPWCVGTRHIETFIAG